MKTRRNIAVVVASGIGSRFGGEIPKQFVELAGKPLAVHCLGLFERNRLIDEIILVVPEQFVAYASREIVDKYNLRKIKKITAGGETRQESVFAGLSACPGGIDLAVIHDAVRPFLSMDLLDQLVVKADKTGAAILAVPARESIKLADGEVIERTLKRDTIWIAQTPQVFRFDDILNAHRRAETAGNEATDDAELYEQYCGQVAIVRGSYNNIKITTKGDFAMAQVLAGEIL